MTKTAYTPEARAKLENYLSSHDLPSGLGDEESACSIAAINLALTGDLTDDIPDCMSGVLGPATIALQDFMPANIRNSDRYKAWLPTAAGTGRDHEQERLAVLMDWMWSTVLPHLQGLADGMEFGSEWQKMCEQRTVEAARAAARAADAAARNARAAVHATDAARAARAAAARAAQPAQTKTLTSDAARAARAATHVADAAARAARAVHTDADVGFWRAVDPIGVLERMTKIGED